VRDDEGGAARARRGERGWGGASGGRAGRVGGVKLEAGQGQGELLSAPRAAPMRTGAPVQEAVKALSQKPGQRAVKPGGAAPCIDFSVIVSSALVASSSTSSGGFLRSCRGGGAGGGSRAGSGHGEGAAAGARRPARPARRPPARRAPRPPTPGARRLDLTARANATRCFSPPLSRRPRSPTMVSYPCGGGWGWGGWGWEGQGLGVCGQVGLTGGLGSRVAMRGDPAGVVAWPPPKRGRQIAPLSCACSLVVESRPPRLHPPWGSAS
jgi:hypothetical protein